MEAASLFTLHLHALHAAPPLLSTRESCGSGDPRNIPSPQCCSSADRCPPPACRPLLLPGEGTGSAVDAAKQKATEAGHRMSETGQEAKHRAQEAGRETSNR